MQIKDIEILFQGYLDNELDHEDIKKVEEYLNENEEAKKVFEDLKKNQEFFKKTFDEFKNLPIDQYIYSLIDNYPIKEVTKPIVSIFQNIFIRFSFVNFAGGAAIASVLGFFAFNMQINSVQYYTMANNEINTIALNQTVKKDIERVLNQNNQSVSGKIDELENILNTDNFKNIIKKNMLKKSDKPLNRDSINLSELNFTVNQLDDNNNCILIEVSDENNTILKTFCNLENEWELID